MAENNISREKLEDLFGSQANETGLIIKYGREKAEAIMMLQERIKGPLNLMEDRNGNHFIKTDNAPGLYVDIMHLVKLRNFN